MFIRNILLIIGASAIALGILIAGFLWLRPKTVEQPGGPAAISRTVVLVAAHPIPAGELLRDEDMAWREVVGPPPPAGSIRRDQVSRSQMVGAVTREALTQSQVITDAAVIRKDDQKFLAAVLSPGYRAVTIDVDASQSAAGLILPDDRVDAILVQHATEGGAPGANGSPRSVAVLLLQDIRVIAVDRLIDRPPTPTAAVGKPPAPDIEAPPKTMTLEVTERDAQRLLLAAQVGKVDLSLRSLARAREPPVAAWGLDSAVYASDISPLHAAPAAMSGAGFGPSGLGSASPSVALASQPPVARGLASIHILRGTKEGP